MSIYVTALLEEAGVSSMDALYWAYFQVHGKIKPSLRSYHPDERTKEKILTELARAILEEIK